MSETIDNNVEVQEEEFFIEEIDLEAIGKKFESESVFTRIKLLLRGLKAPAGSREYKEALIELQRLLAPVGAIIIPLIFIAILFVCSVPEKTNKDLRNINVAKAEEEAQKKAEQDALDAEREQALKDKLGASYVPPVVSDTEDVVIDVEAAIKEKYVVDNGMIVSVTYESGYTFILNYNIFDVTVDGLGDTVVEKLGYLVIDAEGNIVINSGEEAAA